MQHVVALLENPWIMVPLLILFFGEYIPFTTLFWQKIGLRLRRFGEWFLLSYENRLYRKKERWIEEKKISLKLNNFFARILFFAFSSLIVVFLELFWELGFKGVTRSLERSKIAIKAERWIHTLPNWAVLALFGTPFLFMELIGIFALGAFVSGHISVGIGLYLFKVLFFIPVHFILHVGEAQLMAIEWFRRRYNIITDTLQWFKQSQTYVKIHNISETLRAYITALKERFFQTVILLKKAFEHDDILSPECEAVREEILHSSEDERKARRLYETFFNCIDRHIKGRKTDKTPQHHNHTKE